jgi:outer membrane protein OmpA-like peptidoglycan-associated protein
MNKLLFFTRVGIFLAILYQPLSIYAQIGAEEHPNYVVVGAFAIHKNAIKFTRYVNRMQMPAKYEMNPNRNLYYVYVLATSNKQVAVGEAIRLRNETQFSDSWVYHGLLGDAMYSASIDINPVTKQKMDQVRSDVTSGVRIANPMIEPSITSTNVVATNTNVTSTPDATITASTTPVVENPTVNPAKKKSSSSDETDGKPFLFTLYRGTDNTIVTGEVEIIDTEKSRKIGTYEGNIPVKISSPTNKTGEIALICDVFGYRKVQKTINYNNPESEMASKDEQGNTVVPFELVRLQKGDIAVMYNVFFFKDAAVMRPESQYEVNTLLLMLKENPKYRIRIHGHTNGGASGKIITMGPSKSFFSLTDTNEGFGTAKSLSEERASIIREYLITKGVDGGRMEVKAWGGKRPVYDRHHTMASANVRVEVEILED